MDCPSQSAVFLSAPFSTSNLTISLNPLFDAQYNGVNPLLSLILRSAPFSIRKLAISFFPFLIEYVNGVNPLY